jgi:SPP1 gp7 family putative phage head morphogenesis protein
MLLRPVFPNAGIEADYRRRILRLVDEMAASVTYWLKARYRANEPKIMAMDDLPASEMQDAVNEMTRQWRKRFSEGAPELAKYFATAAYRRSDKVLAKILKDAGFTVDFKLTPAMRDVLRATIEQNVGLIKSIPEQYLTQVQGAVLRSVTAGRDLGSLAKELQEHYGVTRRRAAFISRDQNNKATSAFDRVRQMEAGLKATWRHSHAGKEPRPTHVAMDGKEYDPAKGMYDADPKVRRFIWPGELPRCRCFSRAVVKGFS